MQIQEINRKIREKSLTKIKQKQEYGKNKPLESFSASWANMDRLYEEIGYTIFIVLPTSGCQWAKDTGGCTMCSYITDSSLINLTPDEINRIFQEEWEKQISKINLKEHQSIAVKIFVSGSFLNTNEIPIESRNQILDTLNQCTQLKEVIIESKPEYINQSTLLEVIKRIPEKTFEIGIGLETLNEETRLEKINKGITNKQFEESVNTINSIKEYDIRAKAYLLVKPILISEKQAIQEAIDSAVYAYEKGVKRIAYCPATIHSHTFMEYLWKRGAYQPPWIWSTIEIIKQATKKVDIPIIMDTAGFGTRRGPFNCKKCNEKLKNLIVEYNQKQKIPEELENYSCSCQDNWKADLEFTDILQTTTNPKDYL